MIYHNHRQLTMNSHRSHQYFWHTKVNYKTGQIYDSISRKWVDPSNVEFGHKTGREFAFYRDMAESQGWTQAQFNDFMNNPDFYAWQDIHCNRSHAFEAQQ